ncbi:unnamed protein product [Gadus morhua 'NCC']
MKKHSGGSQRVSRVTRQDRISSTGTSLVTWRATTQDTNRIPENVETGYVAKYLVVMDPGTVWMNNKE